MLFQKGKSNGLQVLLHTFFTLLIKIKSMLLCLSTNFVACVNKIHFIFKFLEAEFARVSSIITHVFICKLLPYF